MADPTVPPYPSGVPPYAQQMTSMVPGVSYETLQQLVAGMDPTTRAKLSRLGVLDDYQKFYGNQMAESEQRQLANEANEPQGREVGGTYVAPSALQYLAKAIRGVQAKRKGEKAEEDYAGTITEKEAGLQSILDLLGIQGQSQIGQQLADALRGQDFTGTFLEQASPGLFGG